MDAKIGVLGGGVSGLTFASLVDGSVVLEKEASFGGLMRSIREGGYTFDLGSHIIFSKNDQTLSFMRGCLGDNIIKHRRNTKIIYKGLKVKYPFENGLGDLPKHEALDCVLDYAKEYFHMEKDSPEKPKNFREWMHRRFGRAISEKYLYPYNRKIWDYPPELMDCFWVEGRVPQPLLKDVMAAAMGMESEGYLHQLNFFYPANHGIQSITDALTRRIGEDRLRSGFEITMVKKEDGKWIVRGNGQQEASFGRLVSTIHIQDFLSFYKGVPREVGEAAKKLRWNSVYLVMLGLQVPKINDIHWAYIPDADVLPNRISFPSNLSANNAPKNHSSLLAEITFDPAGPKAKLKEKEIVEKTIDDLARIGIMNAGDVVFSKLVKCKYAYVIYDLDYLKNIRIIEDFAKNEGFTLLGRFSEFRYYNSDRCIESAMEKARLYRN